eukprot:TRINITY_DN4605_c0_g1_i3.p1 TRINITY_DN4605_c0_g1~~TRINITY_DN4605_c0_g1_i3.p1  ORF type:complete len:1596 (+),score=470.23 TRINITY_DN4605_c0_g1_i3:112-4899(+)
MMARRALQQRQAAAAARGGDFDESDDYSATAEESEEYEDDDLAHHIQCVEVLHSDASQCADGQARKLVFRGSFDGGTELAVKVLHGLEDDSLQQLTEWFEDRPEGPTVVRYRGVTGSDASVWILMDYCDGGSVGDAAVILPELSEDELRAVVWLTLHALQPLHARGGCAHGNLKPNNLLLTSTGDLLLGDPGEQWRDRFGQMAGGVHPAQCCPEALELVPEGEEWQQDIWALGVSLIEAADRVPPFQGDDPATIVQRLSKEGAPRVAGKKWSDPMQAFVRACCSLQASQRHPVADLLSHEWLRRLDGQQARGLVQGLVARLQRTMNEWSVANGGKPVPRSNVREVFREQWQRSVSSSAASTPASAVDPHKLNSLSGTELPDHMRPLGAEAEARPAPARGSPRGRARGGPASPPMSPRHLRRSMAVPEAEREAEPCISQGLRDPMRQYWLPSKPEPGAKFVSHQVRNVRARGVYLLGANLDVTVSDMQGKELVIGPSHGVVQLNKVRGIPRPNGDPEDSCSEDEDVITVAVAAYKVVLRQCSHMKLYLYSAEPPVLHESCAVDTIQIYPWSYAYPGQAAAMRRARLDPFRNRWCEVDCEALLLPDPYLVGCPEEIPLVVPWPGEAEQAVHKMRDDFLRVKQDDPQTLLLQGARQVRVTRRSGELGEHQNVALVQCKSSSMFLLDNMGELTAQELDCCLVVLGPTLGVTLQGLTNCVIIGICGEVTLMGCDSCVLFIRTRQPPKVVQCREIRFAEFNTCWAGLSEQVQRAEWSSADSVLWRRGQLYVKGEEGDKSTVGRLHEEGEPMRFREIPLAAQGQAAPPPVFPFGEFPPRADRHRCDFPPIAPPLRRMSLGVLPAPAPATAAAPHLSEQGGELVLPEGEGLDPLHICSKARGKVLRARRMTKCFIYVYEMLKEAELTDLTNCQILLGPTQGRVHLRGVRDCTVVAACGSLYAEDCSDCKLFLWCVSSPVLHRCSQLELEPWNIAYPGLARQAEQAFGRAALREEGRYCSVVDLSVLDYSVQPPHYEAFPPAVEQPLQELRPASPSAAKGRPSFPFRPCPPCEPGREPPPTEDDPDTTETAAQESSPQRSPVRELPSRQLPPSASPPPAAAAPESPPRAPSPPAAAEGELWRAAAAAAVSGADCTGPWAVTGEPVTGHPKQKKWDKPMLSDFEIKWQRGMTLVSPEGDRRGQKLVLQGLFRCRVIALGAMDCIDVDDCEDCELVLGPCSSALFVRDCTGLCLTAACRQLRMRDVQGCELFIHTETDPCIEACSGVVLRPLNAKIPGLSAGFAAAKLHAEQNRFRHAADFTQFADTKAQCGFELPPWAGVVRPRSVAPPGQGAPDWPEGVSGILDGTLSGGESLEQAAGTFRMGEQGVDMCDAQEAAWSREDEARKGQAAPEASAEAEQGGQEDQPADDRQSSPARSPPRPTPRAAKVPPLALPQQEAAPPAQCSPTDRSGSSHRSRASTTSTEKYEHSSRPASAEPRDAPGQPPAPPPPVSPPPTTPPPPAAGVGPAEVPGRMSAVIRGLRERMGERSARARPGGGLFSDPATEMKMAAVLSEIEVEMRGLEGELALIEASEQDVDRALAAMVR